MINDSYTVPLMSYINDDWLDFALNIDSYTVLLMSYINSCRQS